MEWIVAEDAGFCFGVKRAVEGALKLSETEKVAVIGPLIHNKAVVRELEDKGIRVINRPEEALPGETIVIRSHGEPPETYRRIEELGIPYVDFTCPDVKKIHRVAQNAYENGKKLIIAGNPGHPEVNGTNGFAEYSAVIINSPEETENTDFSHGEYVLVAQTTFSSEKFRLITERIKEKLTDRLEIVNTICPATERNQRRAEEISRSVDKMLVIGDRESSNTVKLYELSKKNQPNTFFIESIGEILLNNFSHSDKIGITAGASTPPAIIKEAIEYMSELENNNQSFEEMLGENMVSLHTGDIVKGTVIQVSNGEVLVNLGYKSDGIIEKEQFSDDPNADPAEIVKPGEEIEVYVIRVNDGDGNVLLSKKRLDSQKGLAELEEAAESGVILPGRIVDVVKGGVIAVINGVRAFVPSSQVSNRYIEDLNAVKGKEFNFKILEFDKAKKRVVAGRRELAATEAEELKNKVFAEIEPGKKLTGAVSRIAAFGAFVDLGGVDGLIHISELSWGRVKKVSDVVKEGDKVTVTVLDLNREKGKISLSLKNTENDPWNNVDEKYAVGSLIGGKVVRMAGFGAFVELEPGVDGLIHISQIADRHVNKPEDELKIGQIITVKVTEIDMENKRISLSKKAADGVNVETDEPAAQAATEEVTTEEVIVEASDGVAEAVADHPREAAEGEESPAENNM